MSTVTGGGDCQKYDIEPTLQMGETVDAISEGDDGV